MIPRLKIVLLAALFVVWTQAHTPASGSIAFPAYSPTSSACSSGVTAGTLSLPTSGIAARTSGAVPLLVLFDASGTTSMGTTALPFHEIRYTWNFGDAGAGTWATTTGGGNTSRNAAYGPISAHVFENAGTAHTVTLTAYDGTNTASCTLTVTTSAAWANNATAVCVSTSGNTTGCPVGVTQAANTSNWATALGNLSGSVKRVLLRCGETWTANNYAITANGPGLIGAYNDSGMVTAANSTCTKPKVNITAGVTALSLGNASGPYSDWRISDIEMNGQSSTTAQGVDSNLSKSGFTQLLFLRTNLHDMTDPFLFRCIGACVDYDQVGVVDSTVTTVLGGIGPVGLWYEGTKLALLGNNMNDSTAAEHVVRLQYVGNGVVSNNIILNAATAKASLTVRGPCQTGSTPGASGGCDVYGGGGSKSSTKVVVSDNKVGQTISGWGSPLNVRTENSKSIEIIQDVIVERNLAVQSGMEVRDAARVTFRDNILYQTTGTAQSLKGVLVTHDSTLGVTCDANSVFNNSTFSNDSTNDVVGVQVDSGCSNTVIKNNATYAPNFPADFHRASIINSGTGTTGASGTQGNSSDAQVTTTDPFAVAAPGSSAITDWKATNYASGGGVSVPVWNDFNLAVPNSPRDVGAVNH